MYQYSIKNRGRVLFLIAIILLLSDTIHAVPTEVSAFFRHGQTFLTWKEDGSREYRIYRHKAPITESNVTEATLLATVDDNSSKSLYGVGAGIGQTHWIIKPIGEADTGLGEQLADNQGLFVHTVQEEEGDFFYAVVSEDGTVADNKTGVIREKKMRKMPIPIYRIDGASDEKDPSQGGMNDQTFHTTYAWFMDYSLWNHEWEGYIFNFIVSTPKDLESRESWSIMHRVDGKSSRLGRYISYSGNQSIGILNESVSPSYPKTTIQDWHYGHVNATKDSVVNYTEHRNILSILFVIDNLRGDRERVWGYGHSMGGSGSLSLGMRYPSLFSMVYACQPATDYGNPQFTWHGNVSASFGSLEENLPIVNLPINHPDFPELDAITTYNGTPVFEWQNPRKQLALRMGDDMALLCLTHGRRDESIDWKTQGAPFVEALLNSKRPFKYIVNDAGHNWQSFNAIHYPQLWHEGKQYGTWFDFPVSTSMPGFSDVAIATDTVASYLKTAEWTVIEDEADSWEMTLKNVGQVCSITPRRCQNFYANPNDRFDLFLNGTRVTEITADADGLVTAKRINLTNEATVRLVNTYRAPIAIVSKTPSGNIQESITISQKQGLTVSFATSSETDISFSLRDLRGRLIHQRTTHQPEQGIASVQWSITPPGVYIVTAKDFQQSISKKIIVK